MSNDLIVKSETEFVVEYEGSYCTTEVVNVLVDKEGVLINGVMIEWRYIDKARKYVDKKHLTLSTN